MDSNNIDWSNIAAEFLEVVFHTLLYSRKIYPDGIFELKKKYGVPVHISKHPELNKYIINSLIAIKYLLSIQKLKQVDICFYNKNMISERFVLVFDGRISETFLDGQGSFLQQVRDSFRALCLKLSVNSNYVKPLPAGSTFKIFIHTTEESSAFMAENPEFQEFPWIEAEPKDTKMEKKQIIPVKNIETNLISMKIYSEYNTNSK